jgi:hypothetical protein
MAGFYASAVNPMDWGILGVGFLVIIFSFFDYYTVSVRFAGFSESDSASAWHGFFGWFAALVALIATALVALEIFAPTVKVPFPIRLVSLGGYALATLCVILALFIYPGSGYSGPGGVGHGFSYWISLVLIIGGTVLSVLRLKETGGKLPWEKGAGGPAAGGPGFGAHGYGGQMPPQGPPMPPMPPQGPPMPPQGPPQNY